MLHRLILPASCIILTLSLCAFADTNGNWLQETGEIININLESGMITINTESGSIPVTVHSNSLILKSKKKIGINELLKGDPVVVRYRETDGVNTAVRIQVGASLLMGAVQNIDTENNLLQIKDQQKIVNLKLAASTLIKQGSLQLTIQDIAEGDFIRIIYKRIGKQNVVVSIDVMMSAEDFESTKAGKKGRRRYH